MYVSKNIKLNKKYFCLSMGLSIIFIIYDMIRFDYIIIFLRYKCVKEFILVFLLFN